jgi:AraC-like DNA-binding protein
MMETEDQPRLVGGVIHKVVFASGQLPDALDDRARFSLWHDQWVALYGSIDLARPEDVPFEVGFEFAPFGEVGVGRFQGTINRTARTSHDVKADGADNFCIGLNNGPAVISFEQGGRETLIGYGKGALLVNSEAGALRSEAGKSWLALNLSRRQLLDMVPGAEDMLALAIDPRSEAMRHLHRYANILLGPDGPGDHAGLNAHIGNTLLDLIALALKTDTAAALDRHGGGLRAARTQAVLMKIRAGALRPGFSSDDVARSLGISRRYIDDLLQETGQSFGDRVMETRLQNAFSMLRAPRFSHLKISDIAYASGFTEVTHFNRSFRRRFGIAPSEGRRT